MGVEVPKTDASRPMVWNDFLLGASPKILLSSYGYGLESLMVWLCNGSILRKDRRCKSLMDMREVYGAHFPIICFMPN